MFNLAPNPLFCQTCVNQGILKIENDIIQDLKSGLINQTDIAKKYNISKSSVTLIKQKNDI